MYTCILLGHLQNIQQTTAIQSHDSNQSCFKGPCRNFQFTVTTLPGASAHTPVYFCISLQHHLVTIAFLGKNDVLVNTNCICSQHASMQAIELMVIETR